MSRRTLGIIVLLVASALLGVLAGQRFYVLFMKTVPPVMVSDFNRGAAHVAFLVYGFVLGIAIFLWSLLAIFLARYFPAAAPGSK